MANAGESERTVRLSDYPWATQNQGFEIAQSAVTPNKVGARYIYRGRITVRIKIGYRHVPWGETERVLYRATERASTP